MAVGTLYHWKYLGFVDAQAIPDKFKQSIIKKFNGNLIKTEKLKSGQSPDVLFLAFRLNDTIRVICTSTKYEECDCLVVLEIIENHKYSSSRVLNDSRALDLSEIQDISDSQENQKVEEVTEAKEPKLGVDLGDRIITLSTTQASIVSEIQFTSGACIVNGMAGSGKTTIAQILLEENRTQEARVLYTTKSSRLLDYVKKQHTKELESERPAQDAVSLNNGAANDCVQFFTYENLCWEMIFDRNNFGSWLKQNNTLTAKIVDNKYARKKKVKSKVDFRMEEQQIDKLHESIVKFCRNQQPTIDTKYKHLISGYLSDTLYNVDKFIHWVRSNKIIKAQKSDDFYRQLYEDMIKVSGGKTLVKKSSFLSFSQELVEDILAKYQNHLGNNHFDLSLGINNGIVIDSRRADLVFPNIENPERYDCILVDESQDLSKLQLQYIRSLLAENGRIIYFMDGNQNLDDTFNLVPEYVLEIESFQDEFASTQVPKYNLNMAYRMPIYVTNLANKVIEIKAHAIGGKLNKHELQRSSVREDENADSDILDSFVEREGYVGWVNSNNASNFDIMNHLKRDAALSIDCIIIVPDEACKDIAKTIFPGGIVATTSQVKGLEFSKVILFDFFSGDYPGNKFYQSGKKYEASKPTPANYPKNTVDANYIKLFNKLFVAITRSTDSVVFVESAANNTTHLYQDTLFKSQLNQGRSIELKESSIDDIMNKIKLDGNKLETNLLLDYIAKLITLIHQDIIKETAAPELSFNYLQYLEHIQTILIERQVPTGNNITKKIEVLTKILKHEDISEHDVSLEDENFQSSVSEEKHIIASRTTTKSTKKKKKKNKEKKKKVEQEKDQQDQDAVEVKVTKEDKILPQDSILKMLFKDSKKFIKSVKENAKKVVKQIKFDELEMVDKQNGESSLHYLISTPKLLNTFILMVETPGFIDKITVDALNAESPFCKSPLHYLLQIPRLCQSFKMMIQTPGFVNKITMERLNIRDSDTNTLLFLLITHHESNELLESILNMDMDFLDKIALSSLTMKHQNKPILKWLEEKGDIFQKMMENDIFAEKVIEATHIINNISVFKDLAKNHDKGREFYASEQFEESIESFGQAISIRPDDYDAFCNKSIALAALERFEEALEASNQAIVIKSNHAQAYDTKGLALHGLERFEEALEAFNQAIALKPNYAEAYNNRGNLLSDLERQEEALLSYDKAIAINSSLADAHYNRGIALQALRRFDDALKAYNRAIVLKPNNDACDAEIYFAKGNALRALGRPKEAIKAYNKAIQVGGDFAEAYNKKGMAQEQMGSLHEALKSYDYAIKLNSSYVEPYSNKGDTLQALDRFEEAIDAYNHAIELAPNEAVCHCNKANVLRVLKRFDESMLAYNHAIELAPDFAEAYFNKALLLRDLKKFTLAIQAFDHSLALNPSFEQARLHKQALMFTVFESLNKLEGDSSQPRDLEILELCDVMTYLGQEYSIILRQKGCSLQNLGRFKEALEAFNRAIELEPNNAQIHFSKANLLKDLNKLEEALVSYDCVVAIKPDFAEAYNNKGNILRSLNRLEEALLAFNCAIFLNPNDSSLYFNIGICLQSLNRLDEALIAYNRLIDLNPNDIEAYYLKGLALKSLNRFEEALSDFNKAIILNPNADVYYQKGFVLQNLNRLDEALAAYDQTISLKIDYRDAYNNKGLILHSLGNIEAAIEEYRVAINIDPNFAIGYYNLGISLQCANNLEEAIKSYNKAIELGFEEKYLYYNKGLALKALGHIKEAVEALNYTIDVNSNFVEAINIRDEILKYLKEENREAPEEETDKGCIVSNARIIYDNPLLNHSELVKIAGNYGHEVLNQLIELGKDGDIVDQIISSVSEYGADHIMQTIFGRSDIEDNSLVVAHIEESINIIG